MVPGSDLESHEREGEPRGPLVPRQTARESVGKKRQERSRHHAHELEPEPRMIEQTPQTVNNEVSPRRVGCFVVGAEMRFPFSFFAEGGGELPEVTPVKAAVVQPTDLAEVRSEVGWLMVGEKDDGGMGEEHKPEGRAQGAGTPRLQGDTPSQHRVEQKDEREHEWQLMELPAQLQK